MSFESQPIQERFKLPEATSEAQELLNQEFPLERRKQMMATAEKDSHGHPAIYYRHFHRRMFEEFMNRGEITGQLYFEGLLPNAHYKNLDDEVDKREFLSLLRDSANFDGMPSKDTWHLYFSLAEDRSNLGDIVSKLVPNISDEDLQIILGDFKYKDAFSLVKKYIDPVYLLSIHSGEEKQQFSDRLSLSLGGAMAPSVSGSTVYVEFVIPSEEIKPHPSTIEREKEVSTGRLKREWITKAFVDSNQLVEEVFHNPSIPVGEFVVRHPQLPVGEAVMDWAYQTPMEDLLPPSLIPVYREQMRKFLAPRP